MDLKELNSWVETDEGKQWLEAQKKGLLDKNSELLESVHKSNADMAELGRRLAAAESSLEVEKAYVSKQVIDRELESLLNNRHFFKTIIPHCIERMKQAYGLTVVADGENNRAGAGMIKDAEGNEKQVPLAECFEHFYKMPETLDLTPSRNVGGGAPGSGSYHIPDRTMNMNGQELARLSDAEFESMRTQALKSARE